MRSFKNNLIINSVFGKIINLAKVKFKMQGLKTVIWFALVLSLTSVLKVNGQSSEISVDLLIIGGGASGTTAGIQASRMGVKTLIVEETEWLGGMLTSAGVSAIDGNHQMPAGLWAEFRQKLYNHYGGPKAVETGWVSNTLFEPHVGNRILKELATNKNLSIWYHSEWTSVVRSGNQWLASVKKGKKMYRVRATQIIDATELGDVMAHLKVPSRIGMDSKAETGEAFAPDKANDIIQDMTYVVVLKDYGANANKTIKKPVGYDSSVFNCCCDVSDPASHNSPEDNCFQMMQYGRLPNNKYMINWPKCGNDIYLNIIEKSRADRKEALKEAKLHTLRFLYYLQTELGYKNLGIADDEFPTKDKFPMIPYHRESRRLKGVVTMTLGHVSNPYQFEQPLYRTGIAVGDYTIDHHHLKNPAAPAIDFVKIKVPSYNVPLGSLIPEKQDGLIIAEKSISVSNIVNGATRLQPVVLTIGQASGALAAIAIKNKVEPRNVNIREVQQALLQSKAYIMPFIDVKPEDQDFASIQRIGATGILEGVGISYKWANQTWFYPEREISEYELVRGLQMYYPQLKMFQASGATLTPEFFVEVLKVIKPGFSYEALASSWAQSGIKVALSPGLAMNRRTAAILIDKQLDPFSVAIDFNGNLK